jgi:predicted DNA-binding transcriptional regulator AlpA
MMKKSPAPQELPELLSAAEAGKMLGCSARTVRRLSDSEDMPPPVHIGALVKWRRSDLVEWINAGCKPCPTRKKTN